jgi:NTE family protein
MLIAARTPGSPGSLELMHTRPDVLVLGVGGVLGEAWMMGVLAGIEDGAGLDMRDCEVLLGSSAGSIVAAHLAAGRAPRRPSAIGTELEPAGARAGHGLALAAATAARTAGRATLAAGTAFVPLALGASAPAGAFARSLALRGLPPASGAAGSLDALREQIMRSGAVFDGRLRIAAVDRASGRRVVFGSPGAPFATVADAVRASCSVPWLFEPVRIGGREYVDGGVWSPTNLDAAPAGRESQVLCLNPTGSLTAATGGPAARDVVLAAVRNVSRSATAVEALALRRRGARVRVISPNRECAATIGADLMATEPRSRVLSAGYRQGLAVAAGSGR